MRLIYTLLAFLAVLSFAGGTASAQGGLLTKGTDFWFAFPYNTSGNNNMEVVVTSEVSTSGTLTTGLGTTVNFTVGPGAPFTTIIPSTHAISASQTFENKGIHIVSNDSINVYAGSSAAGGGDAVCVIPTPSLGNEYRITTYRNLNQTTMLVVGTVNNTQLTITPRIGTVSGNPAGVPFNVTINAGQTYMVKGNGEMTGTYVSANQPINVFAHCRCSQVPSGSSYCDFIWAQSIPLNYWGREYVTGYFAGRNNSDNFRVLAHTNGSAIYINGALVTTLNAGNYYETTLGGGNHITSNNPISVTQFARSRYAAGSTAGDPFMVRLIPTEYYGIGYRFSTLAHTYMSSHYITITTKTANTALVRLDGNPVGGWINSGGGWSFATSTLGTGEHSLVSDSTLNGMVYGWGNVTSEGFFLGASSVPPPVILPAPLLSISGQNLPNQGNRIDYTLGELEAGMVAVERYTEGTEWAAVHDWPVSGKGQGEWLDTDAVPGEVYFYRLRYDDGNGKTHFSSVVEIRSGGEHFALDIYPNPFKSDVQLELQSGEAGKGKVTVLDVAGKLLLNFPLEWDAGRTNLDLSDEFKDLESGVYFLRIGSGDRNLLRKVVKF